MVSKKMNHADLGPISLAKVLPTLQALPEEHLVSPNINLQTVGRAALLLVNRAKQTGLVSRLGSVSPVVWDKKTIERLTDTAHAAIQIDIESAKEGAVETDVKVSPAVVEEAATLKDVMLKTIEYNLGDQEAVALEIADIRAGTGYDDLASDLTRASDLYTAHKKVLAQDKKNYHPADATRAKELSATIRAACLAAEDRVAVYAALRPRVFTELTRLYDEVRGAATFVFRDEPAKLAVFEPLRVAARVASPKHSKTSAPVPVVVTPPVATAPTAPTASTAPVTTPPPAANDNGPDSRAA